MHVIYFAMSLQVIFYHQYFSKIVLTGLWCYCPELMLTGTCCSILTNADRHADRNVLLGLACNENISGVEADLSSNQLSSAGAQILESCIHGVTCLHTLHLHDNGD